MKLDRRPPWSSKKWRERVRDVLGMGRVDPEPDREDVEMILAAQFAAFKAALDVRLDGLRAGATGAV